MDQILVAAAECFGELGYEATTTNAIAARAGISPGSLYQYFTSKEDIAHALAEHYATQLGAARDAMPQPGAADTIEMVVARGVRAIVDFNLANPGFKALFARADMPEAMRDAVAPVDEQLHERVRSALR